MRYIGIDLAWKMKPAPSERRSAVASLDDSARLEWYGAYTTDDEISDAVEKLCKVGCVIGVDAPLVVPPDTDGRRVCEGMLSDMKIRVMPTDPRRFEKWYGGCRGVVLVEQFREMDNSYKIVDRPPASTDKAIVETYPTGSWKRLFGDIPKFKGVPVEAKRRALLRLKDLIKWGMPPRYPPVDLDTLDKSKENIDRLSGLELDIYGDALDAVMSAYTVLLWAKDPSSCEVVGDLKDGFILLPKAPGAR
jgi:predicted RNase H-like nuclease